ncbi:valyl-tRNA synthetase [Phycisphaerales bacterium]|nr:valyl-tRNA synthetase [Phycisphaerales bacterium]
MWQQWIDAGAFHADPARVVRGEARPYCILIPPPNVTAALHLGHALNNTLQDVLVRAHRMMGFETLWMPGTDHAGIATQAVVEKRVWQEEKKRRTDFPREEFIAKIQAYKDEYEAVIIGQLKKMGCSCDWERQRFTMDSVCVRAVREAFFRLFRDGLIYRGKRLVNWDPVLQTAVADDECYDEDVDTSFWYLRYPLVRAHGATTEKERAQGKPPPDDAVPVTWSELASRGYPGAEHHEGEDQAWVTVATTRPETYLGDTAVAVNPRDPRAKALRGLSVELPLVGRVIPIVEDGYVVLPRSMARTEEEENDPKAEFATGFLKVTPAHDQNDYELGQRHGLAMVNMVSPDGRVSDKHGWSDVGDAHLFVGKKMAEARKLVVKEFEARGLLEAVKPYRHSVKHSDRSKAIIEPYLSDQWYVRVTDRRMAARANAALVPEQRTGSPERELGADCRDSVSAAGAPTESARACARGSLSDGSMRFYPARYAKTFEHWHDNIRDWCISRQLWWGHRIPVWTKAEQGDAATLNNAHSQWCNLRGPEDVAVRCFLDGREVAESDVLTGGTLTTHACLLRDDPRTAAAFESFGFVQDPDVLDTWFSSALWPMSTMGWPDPPLAAKETGIADMPALLPAYNPSSVLCTAREIITLWVSRMTMFNRYLLAGGSPSGLADSATSPAGGGGGCGPVPFRDVFIHAVIQDGEGRKMSKMLGNGVDPLDIIATHGADAMRFTLVHMTTQTQDVRLPVKKDANGKNTSEKFDLGRNFATKMWNAAKFAMEKLQSTGGTPVPPMPGGARTLPDRWMLSRLASGIEACNTALANYEFSEYAQTCYTLLWNDFCDWYLEAIKPTVANDAGQRAVLRAALDTILRLLHPVMPFVTEAIYEQFGRLPGAAVEGLTLEPARKQGLLATAGWPIAATTLKDPAAEAQFAKVAGLVTAIREVRAQHTVPFKRKITLHIAAADAQALGEGAALVTGLCNIERMDPNPPAAASVPITVEAREYRLSNLADVVDTDAEKTRLARKIEDLVKSQGTLEGRLANPGYALKAPAHMVQQTRDQLESVRAELAAARKAMEALEA